ncbi:abc transporter like protein [Zymoseptoria brevis]|uniref:Abc transporter like protein n=1 Tax=Zymoseptoria brevis TaxID=1047168 RepID=A0A0F4GPP5_9PEZI|nr:abc transporter like protein [Zymoseptoria brevis]
MAQLIGQVWTLTKKDLLLLARRRWFSAFIRAVAFPIVLTVILASVKTWIKNDGGNGVGTPTPIRSLPEAFNIVGGTRKNFVLVNHGLGGDDALSVIDELTTTARNGNRDVHLANTTAQIQELCPSTSRGVTDCFGAIEFWSSPESNPGSVWNYTIWQDSSIRGADVRKNTSPTQVYTLPLQFAVDSLLSARNNGTRLPDTILQYPYTQQSQAEADFQDSKFFGLLVTQAIAFALFIAMVGIAYHLTGHVVRQREEGMLQLIDAQMPNTSRWECLAARTFATHLAFTIIYMPGYIVCGAVVGTLIYPHSNAGWFVLLYIMAGLAMISMSILASSLFQRQQLSAISAVVAAMVFAIVAQFTQSGQKSTNDAAVIATGLLFPPSSFVYFLVTGAVSEIFSQPLRPQQTLPGLLASVLEIRVWSLTPAVFLGFFAIQIVLYPMLAVVIERFMWGSSFRGRHLRSTAEMEGNALRLSKFSKRYNVAAKKRDRTLAVDELSCDFYAGSITILLGANGSGKSTTLNCIAGLQSITDGRIDIDGSGGIGLCPQKNVMWPDMTVSEHVSFFQRLKNPSMPQSQVKAEVERLIEGCDLGMKVHAKSGTLSGGQQRKLQLAMMLAGGSKVCCIDEASSGIDPLARRNIWEILLRERGHRTLLLTTHFLDECEVLADHIALLSKGKLRAEGSVSELKNSLGGGFRVVLPGHSGTIPGIDVSGSSIKQTHNGEETLLEVPNSKTLTPVLQRLDEQGLSGYKIEGPSIETVFLRLADEMKAETHDKSTAGEHGDEFAAPPMVLHTGKPCGPMKQMSALFMKRVTVLKHNFMPYLAGLFVPLVIAGLVPRFLRNVDSSGLQCRDPDEGTLEYFPNTLGPSSIVYGMTVGPPDVVDELERLVPTRGFCHQPSYYAPYSYCENSDTYSDSWNATSTATSLDALNAEVLPKPGGYDSQQGGFFIRENEPPVLAILTSYGFYTSVTTLGALDMALSNTTVAVSYESFGGRYTPRDFYQSLVAVFTTIGFCLFPGLFTLYPTRERLQKVRAMQYSNGITSGPLWVAYALFDFCFLLLIAILVTVIWLTNGYGYYGLGYMFVVFLLYGLAATTCSYVISLFAPSQLAGVAMTVIVQVVIAMLYFVGCFLTVDMAENAVIPRNLDILYYTIALICPAVSLLRALLVTMNIYSISCDGSTLASYGGAIDLFGGPILYLVLQFIVFVMILIFYESGGSLEAFGIRLGAKKNHHHNDAEKDIEGSDAESAEEVHRLSSLNDGLRVQHLSKTFGRNKAVDDISFGILPSEKFAFIGPNGAGESTSISLIRGELRPDSSPRPQVHIAGDSLFDSPVSAKSHLGVCPQFDSVDSMTLSEHLHFYARARGLQGKDKNSNVDEIITRLGLTEHRKKLVKKLSGGTKRKLSLGIALISNPSVLLLDEPSSGMDAAAKRTLWATLRAISAGRSLLITTHSMEEADALCDRAGIIAKQMLALGTISDLHAKYADRVYVQLVHNEAPRSTDQDMEKLRMWVRSTFLVAETERSVGGQVRFAVPIQRDGSAPSNVLDGSHMGKLFQAIEAKKEEVGIRDYSIERSSLEQVFLNVVGRHGVEEENSHEVERKGLVQKLLRR